MWVRPSSWQHGFERTLLAAVLDWLRDDWELERPFVITNEALDHQIATIESLGLTRRVSRLRLASLARPRSG